jgi:hypothetical protein
MDLDKDSILRFRAFLLKILVPMLLIMVWGAVPGQAVELKISRDVVQKTLKQQLFSGPDGRYYLKGNAQSPCYVYAEDAQLSFVGDRVVVTLKTHAKLGKTWGNSCVGLTLSNTPAVSLAPFGAGEMLGFRDAKLDKIVDQKELNFLLTPFLSHQLPSNMQVNAADLLRKTLVGSTAATGFKITLDKLEIRSMHIMGDDIVIDADGDINVK